MERYAVESDMKWINGMNQRLRSISQGYRLSSTEGHIAVVKFLHASLRNDIGDRMIMVLNSMRKKRHRVLYEEMDIVSEGEAEQALEWAQEFVDKVDEILRKKAE